MIPIVLLNSVRRFASGFASVAISLLELVRAAPAGVTRAMAIGGGAPQPRKIDLLTTTVSGAEQASAALLEQIQTREAAAREEIKTAIAERIAALQEREKVAERAAG